MLAVFQEKEYPVREFFTLNPSPGPSGMGHARSQQPTMTRFSMSANSAFSSSEKEANTLSC